MAIPNALLNKKIKKVNSEMPAGREVYVCAQRVQDGTNYEKT